MMCSLIIFLRAVREIHFYCCDKTPYRSKSVFEHIDPEGYKSIMAGNGGSMRETWQQKELRAPFAYHKQEEEIVNWNWNGTGLCNPQRPPPMMFFLQPCLLNLFIWHHQHLAPWGTFSVKPLQTLMSYYIINNF